MSGPSTEVSWGIYLENQIPGIEEKSGSRFSTNAATASVLAGAAKSVA